MEATTTNTVTLRRGTCYQVVFLDGTLSAGRFLTEDVEVAVADLGPGFNVYENAEGQTLLVRVENEVR